MKVIDDFLPNDKFETLKSNIFGQTFPWYFNNSKSHENDDNYQFVHIFFWENKILSPYWNSIAPILDSLKAKKIIRVKANLTPKKKENIKSEMHIDTEVKDSKTAVFYCNTNNGSTLFANGKDVPSKENRIVTFDSNILHCGVDCTDQNIRVVINFNYL